MTDRDLHDRLDELEAAAAEDDPDRCSECGGYLEGSDDAAGATAPFVTYECTCDEDALGDVSVSWDDDAEDLDDDADVIMIDFTDVNT